LAETKSSGFAAERSHLRRSKKHEVFGDPREWCCDCGDQTGYVRFALVSERERSEGFVSDQLKLTRKAVRRVFVIGFGALRCGIGSGGVIHA
jgi:hypothetical protein